MSETPAFAWPAGIRTAVSLSFDDARESQLDLGLPMLNRYGVRATFYVSLQPMRARLSDWNAAAATGHEIGNHSVSHACSGNFGFAPGAAMLEHYTLERMERELLEANAAVSEALGRTPVTFAYPCGQSYVGRGLERRSYVPLVARHFLAGRGFREEHLNDPCFCDLAKAAGTECDCLSSGQVLKLIDSAASAGHWMVLAAHDVGEGKRHQTLPRDTLEAVCSHCTDPGNGVWIDTVESVAAYIAGSRSVQSPMTLQK